MKKINLEVNLLDIDEINDLYKKHVDKPDEYFRKANDEYHKLSDSEKSEIINQRKIGITEKEISKKFDSFHILEMVLKFPNDQTLGNEIRKYYNSLKND